MLHALLAVAPFVGAPVFGASAPTVPPQPAPPPRTPPMRVEDEPEVGFELLVDRTAVAAGELFHVVVHLELPPEWHVYWINPGDSGMRTEVTLTAPDGFEAAEARFPGPTAIPLPGDLVSYGYEGDAFVFVPVRAPDPLPAGPATFAVSARWLVCKEACFLQEDSAEVEVRLGAEGEPAHAELFAGARAHLPRPFAELEGTGASWSRDGARHVLALRVPGDAPLSFFPFPKAPLKLVAQRARDAEGARELVLELEARHGDDDARAAAHGLLQVGAGADARYYELRLGSSDGARNDEP